MSDHVPWLNFTTVHVRFQTARAKEDYVFDAGGLHGFKSGDLTDICRFGSAMLNGLSDGRWVREIGLCSVKRERLFVRR